MHKKFNDLESVTEQISRTWILSALICQAPNLYSLNYLIGFFEIRKHILGFLKKKSPPPFLDRNMFTLFKVKGETFQDYAGI